MADYSITAVTRRAVFTGSAGRGPYSFTFPVLAETDLAVYIDSTAKTRTTHWTASISSANGTGSITFDSSVTAPTSDNTITIVGARAIERTTDFVTAGDLLASSLNTELDSQTIFNQQVSEDAARAIKAPVYDPASIDMTLPAKATRAGKALTFNSSTGNPEANQITPQTVSVSTSTVGAGGSATGSVSYSTSTGAIAFSLGLPTGATGSTGSAGAAATIAVNSVSELSPGATPTVANAGSSSAASLNFGIPGTQIWSTGTSLPGSPADQDLFLFTAAVGSGLTWYDTDGSSSLSSAAKGDIAKYQTSNTRWVKQVNIIGATGAQGTQGIQGNVGSSGSTGASGVNSGLSMTWNSSTSDADPGNGKIAFNSGTLGSVSILYVDSQDDAGANIESFVRSWDDAVNSTARGIITITKEGTPSTFWVGKISSAVVNASGYTKVNVTHIVSNGSFTNNDGIGVHFSYSGADGADGTDGSGSMSNFTLTADSGSNQTIADGNTLDIEGGNSITTVVGATDKVTINADDGTASAKGAVIVAGTSPVSVGYSSGTATVAVSDASTSAKGIGSFSSDNFAVSSGAVTIKDQGVALAEIVNVSATDKILGRSSSGAGTIEEIDCTSAGRALLDDANASAQRTTLGLAIGSDIQSYNSGTKIAGLETIWIPAVAMYPNSTNGCADIEQVELSNGPEIKVLDFDPSSDENAQFAIAMPKSWNEGTVTFQAYFTVTGTNTGTVAWGLSGVALSDNDSINTAFGTNVVATAKAHSGTSNDLNVTAESGAVTIAGTPAVGDQCYFQIMRDVSADNQSGDARLLGIKMFFTTNAANDA